MATSVFLKIFTAPLDIIYSIKWILTYICIRIYKFYNTKRFDIYDTTVEGDPLKLGFAIPQIERDLESPLPEYQLQNSQDEILFYGSNSKSDCLLVRIARSPNQEAEAWIFLKLADGKTYRLSETVGYQQPFEGKCMNFTCGKLQIQHLCPMRRWRIFYCGMLKSVLPNGNYSDESVFVKFVFMWKASSDVYDLSLHSNPEGFSSALAKSCWKVPIIPPVREFTETVNFYGQAGIIDGTISVDGVDDYDVYLFGEKVRNIGKLSNVAGYKYKNILGNTPENGFIFYLGQATVPHIFEDLPYGFIVQPNGDIEDVKDINIDIKTSRKRFKIDFSSSEEREITVDCLSDPVELKRDESGYIELVFVEVHVENKKGYGILISGENIKERRDLSDFIPIKEPPEFAPLTVQFSDVTCAYGEVSGGKGSSLGRLTQLSFKNKSFTVPKGIVVTTAAYEAFLTKEIKNAVKHLENIVYGNVEGDAKEACLKMTNIVEKSLLPKKICNGILEDLREIFGDEVENKRFAVRSSATGEDTEAMSAAGQMDTFLGVQGLEEIFKAVKKCWASQFGYIAIEYKRRNGQILNSPMAVVVQEMVASDVSGVIFTCDPVTNNPAFITITANYGLGETVVSGSVEPDTISLRRMESGELKIDSVTVGSKHQRIVMKDSGGTITEDLPENSKEQACLSEETSLSLGNLAIEIEKYYKSSRDIEFGMVGDKVYMLQSRPVTNIAGETDYEIKHEFDCPLRCEREYFSVANVGEVMPGASSPLGMDLIVKVLGIALKAQARNKGAANNLLQSNYYPSGIISFYNHMMMTLVDLLNRYGQDTPESKGVQISIFGRILDDPDLLNYAREKYVEPPSQSIRTLIEYYVDLFLHVKGIEETKKKLHSYEMKFLNTKTAKEAYSALMKSCSDFDDGTLRHMNSSENSSNWNMYLFTILSNTNGKFDSDVYSDFARLLSTSSNVESAEVPQAMKELALQIQKEISSEGFKAMTPEEAENWLKTSSTASGISFRQFLKKHGHRCLKEFDVRTVTWAMDPKPLIKILQNMVGSCKEGGKKDDDDIDILISELNVPLGFWSKLMLKFVLPQCRKGVRAREACKSLTIKSFDYLRQGYRHLAKLMVSEGRIPDADLIFFLTLYEIDELLKTRSPSLISRAVYRRKIFPTIEDYIFPEIMKGMPKPVNFEESSENYDDVADLTIKGYPVSQGVVKAYARVAMSLDEAALLKPGEILITYSTDIGWSPYFPIVAGVVTELGGLISHGAVVSREYGLPCLVGAQGATKLFKTGDYVVLDGKKGILQRLPQP